MALTLPPEAATLAATDRETTRREVLHHLHKHQTRELEARLTHQVEGMMVTMGTKIGTKPLALPERGKTSRRMIHQTHLIQMMMKVTPRRRTPTTTGRGGKTRSAISQPNQLPTETTIAEIANSPYRLGPHRQTSRIGRPLSFLTLPLHQSGVTKRQGG